MFVNTNFSYQHVQYYKANCVNAFPVISVKNNNNNYFIDIIYLVHLSKLILTYLS